MLPESPKVTASVRMSSDDLRWLADTALVQCEKAEKRMFEDCDTEECVMAHCIGEKSRPKWPEYYVEVVAGRGSMGHYRRMRGAGDAMLKWRGRWFHVLRVAKPPDPKPRPCDESAHGNEHLRPANESRQDEQFMCLPHFFFCGSYIYIYIHTVHPFRIFHVASGPSK